MKFDRSNKFDFCYYGQVNSLWVKSSVASKWASKRLVWDDIYFAGDGILYGTLRTNGLICSCVRVIMHPRPPDRHIGIDS